MIKPIHSWLFFLVATTAFEVNAAEIANAPLEVNQAEGSSTRFVEVDPQESGLRFVNVWTPPRRYEAALSLSFAGGGVCLGDYDGDGLTDIYLSRPFGGGRLYRNLGELKFEDATEKAGLREDSEFWEAGCTFVDIDNDGDLDLYICGFEAPNRLYLNENGKFRNVAGKAWLNFTGMSVMMAFADYDRDGDLDGYLVTNRPFSPEGNYDVTNRRIGQAVFRQLEKDDAGKFVMPEKLRQIFDLRWNPYGKMDMFIRAGQYDKLYLNRGSKTPGGIPRFLDMTEQAGVKDNGLGLSATWWDYNDDGYPDIYVANDYYGDDRLYHNNGDGTFKDVAKEVLPHTPWYSMGTNVADLNNDGLMDFMGTDMAGTNHYLKKMGMGDMDKNAWFLEAAEPRQYMRNAVYINTGVGRMLEAAKMTGLSSSDWTWANKFGDLDCDGWVDSFIANGMTGDLFNSDVSKAKREGTYVKPGEDEPRPEPKKDANLAFRNLGDLKFKNVGKDWGLDKKAVSFGAALGDLDNDGDLDLVVNHFEEPTSVYENRTPVTKEGGHRVRIRLVGTKSNRWGIDARVRIETSVGVQSRVLTLSRGFYSADEPVVYFGLGKDTTIKRLTVEWPSGIVQEFKDLKADQFYTITEADKSNAPTFREERSVKPPMFSKAVTPAGVHKEQPFDDYQRQPLIPQKYSQLGPGQAWGDIDGDGDDDLFVGGSRGFPSTLHVNQGAKGFQPVAFPHDPGCEDMGALFFDVDGDEDLDLYVVSGGVECEPGDASLRDRIYFNDGKGNFSSASKESLPDHRDSGSVVCAADYDQDGDLDLFVGGRVVPGKYPETPGSHLLHNDGKGKFTEATPPGLGDAGLVTSALWSDIDQDGWIDLLVTLEWGPVKVFRNEKGVLKDLTAGSGIESLSGWWNSIAGADIDGDGDIDYAVGNFGLNTKYHVSEGHPTLLYYGDLDGSGEKRIVEAGFEGETLYPGRGRSCSSGAMPSLAKKFPTFKSFALAGLKDIYEPNRLSTAIKLSANTLESGVLINTTKPGSGRPSFEFRPLPRIAQIAPTFGIALGDLDGDGHADLCLAQNFYGPQRETGHMDGSVSLLLLGDGEGNFDPIWPDRSGIVVAGDATSLTIADIDNDRKPDLVFGVNDGELVSLKNSGAEASFLPVRIHATGARVTLVPKSGSGIARQTIEISTGGGYLSQGPATRFFGLGKGKAADLKHLEVVWPGGEKTEHSLSDWEPGNGEVVCLSPK